MAFIKIITDMFIDSLEKTNQWDTSALRHVTRKGACPRRAAAVWLW